MIDIKILQVNSLKSSKSPELPVSEAPTSTLSTSATVISNITVSGVIVGEGA